jgi:pilus assembly protein CpaF
MTETTIVVSVRSVRGRWHQAEFRADRALWFGRDDGCEVVLKSAHVSRRHAIVTAEGGSLRVTSASERGIEVRGEHVVRGDRSIGGGGRFSVGPFAVEVSLCPRVESAAEPCRVSGPERRRIHRLLVDHLDLGTLEPDRIRTDAIRADVARALDGILREQVPGLGEGPERASLVRELCDEALGLGPLEALLADPTVQEIMVVAPATLFVERNGRIERTSLRFTDAETVRATIERIVTPLGRRIDESSPLVDARLPDGSRVNAVIPPLAVKGPCITIRKFRDVPFSLAEIVDRGGLSAAMARFLERSVMARKNLVVSGGTGSGKTTLLNALSAAIPGHERVVTIEDAAELRLGQPHVVALEARPPNREGEGACSIRDLLRNALRMRPDRVIVGECRGGEALDMLQAMNTGHEGSMTTTHANSPREAVSRLETLCLMSGLELPVRAIRNQIGASVHLIVQTSRASDGSRRVTSIAEVTGVDRHGAVHLEDVFRFERTGTGPNGEALGEHLATGWVPTFVGDLERLGLSVGGDWL